MQLRSPMSYFMPFVGIFFLINMVSSSIRIQVEDLETQRHMVRQRGSEHSRAGLVYAARRRQSGALTDSFFSEPLVITTTTKKSSNGSYRTKEHRDALLLLLEQGHKHFISNRLENKAS
jgi:hypothetical protein